MRNWRAVPLAVLLISSTALAKGHDKPRTLREALADAEQALDSGRLGDAIEESDRLQRTHGLTHDEKARLDVIIARCDLVTGKFVSSEKRLAKIVKGAPNDTRLAEWYARALDGVGNSDAAYALLRELAQKDALAEGDSYWALAQLERQKGDAQAARAHAKLALEKPIVLQSEELDHAIHEFIDELTPKKP
jgi:tetratricopeptide (TPR) repeat protein